MKFERKECAMVIEKVYEKLEPRLRQMVAEAYKDGAEDMNRRLLDVYRYGQIDGYAKALADNGIIEIGDVDG